MVIEKGLPPPWLMPESEFRKVLYQKVPKIETQSVSWTPLSVAANTTAEQTVTVTGVTTSDIIYCNKPTHQAGLAVGQCRVTASNTVGVTFINATGGAIVPTAEAYKFSWIRL